MNEILPLWNELMNDKELVDDIKLDIYDVPFAKDKAYDILCINQRTGAIFAVWRKRAGIRHSQGIGRPYERKFPQTLAIF